MKEDGINSGARNVGRFFLAAIPYVLGLAATAWLGVYIGIHNFSHQLTQEERAAIYTGAKDRPKTKIAIESIPKDCTTIVRSDIDGTSLVLYARNDCTGNLRYMEYHWEELSPNGTVIHSGYTNQFPIPTQPGDVAEGAFTPDSYEGVDNDNRVDRIRVWTKGDLE